MQAHAITSPPIPPQVLRRYSRLFGSPGASPALRGERLGVAEALEAACGGGGSNTGIEALDLINETHLLAICEAGPDETDFSGVPVRILQLERGPAGAGQSGRWSAAVAARLTLRLRGRLTPSDVARVPPSRYSPAAPAAFLLLERSIEPQYGNAVRVRLLRGDALAQAAADGGEVDPPELFTFTPDDFATDNFEGIAVALARAGGAEAGEGAMPAPSGAEAGTEGYRIFLVSDDNFNPGPQRTLLYELFWPGAPLPNAIADRPACCARAKPPSAGGEWRAWAVGGAGAAAAGLCLLLLCACRRRAGGGGGWPRRQQRPAVQLGTFPVQARGGGPAALQLQLR